VIPKNAITMLGTIDQCWLLAFRVDPSVARRLLPTPLELVEYGGCAFFNVVISHLSQMRPAPLPGILGMSYWHVAYRLYARIPSNSPEEGLYFLRSDADSPLMVAAGNALTDFRFHRAQVEARRTGERTRIQVDSADAPLCVEFGGPAKLASGSPFPDLRAAADFLKYKPAGLAVRDGQAEALRITRDESAWRSRLLGVEPLEVPYLQPFGAEFEVAYEVDPVNYRWNRARRVAVAK